MTSEAASTGEPGQQDDRAPVDRQIAQQQYAINHLPPSARYGPANWRETGVEYLYDSRGLIVRGDYVERVKEILRALNQAPPDERQRQTAADDPETWTRPVIDGAWLVRTDLNPDNAQVDAMTTADLILGRPQRGVDDAVAAPFDRLPPGSLSLHHYLSIAGNGGRCAPVEPLFAKPDAPPAPPVAADPEAGRGVRVLVLDTGYDTTVASAWLHGADPVTGEPDAGIHGGVIDRYGGHGTFIAGVLRCVAPAAEVRVLNPFTGTGEVTEADLVAALQRALATENPDLISISAGTTTYDEHGPLAMHAFGENVLSRHKGVAVVAAAGNDAHRERFYPAAMPWAVGVGAYDTATGRRADFSNFGGWVDVFAPGVDLVNAFPTGLYTYGEPPRTDQTQQFGGMARWSGTSFSTPLVAGLIAARMSRTGQNARAAAADLVLLGQQNARPGIGAVLNP
jgi:subtilisin family serine protease